ncbi:uncharacterized protein I206_102654 [Kwoniella pini CBS 10737]|uniref:Methyltransferase-domain-containing protein n=1 Tax=Kwoniella pini CBS 10737 TaxID=1296096 RepID=A0A1B9I5Z4_9TREE|nr:uncharacterized protein I206_03007 [Kwoniella pini CBS 10737]OCF50945.1 hypothetical protein I206_03007 [Kwoniella pini CBS 10737]
MYWYISFLRPPPVSTSSSTKEIIITPQIANDLRTELRYEPTLIHYTWQRISPSVSPPNKSQELTTFIPPQSTYKPIHIPLPDNVQIGESWRLGLFSPSITNTGTKKLNEPSSSLLQLCEDEVDILGVWSEGINIIRSDFNPSTSGVVKGINSKNQSNKIKDKRKGKEKYDIQKQGRITREFKLSKSEDNDNEEEEEGIKNKLKIIEQTSFDLDKKIWDSGLALSSWFWKYLEPNRNLHTRQLAIDILNLISRKEDLNILEIGSGTGLVSIALTLAFKKYLSNHKRLIIATDLDTAIPLMNENLEYNNLKPFLNSQLDENDIKSNTIIQAKILDWDKELPNWLFNSWPELIVAADVTYNTSTFPSLLRTLISLFTSNSLIKPLLILAYKQRDPAERELWNMLSSNGIQMIMIDKIQGTQDEGETELWVGKLI